MIKLSKLIALTVAMVCLTLTTCALDEKHDPEPPVVRVIEPVAVKEEPVVRVTIMHEIVEAIEEPEVVEEEMLSQEEIDLIALVTMAEAEGEPEEGKRLVIDTILNRVDHERFPDTVYGVIYQRNQFTSMSNGRVDRCRVTDEIRKLVVEELSDRTNHDVVFFTANKYGKYGKPLFSVANHYFSSYS